MRKLSLAMMGLAIAGLMTMVSCRKPNVNNFNTTGEKITFSATIDNGSKTTLAEDIILWSIEDQISINGMEYTLASDPGETSGEFVGGDVEAVGGKYFASYPYSGKEGYENNGSSVKFNIPANTDNYNTLVGQIPMVAYTNDKGGGLGFKSMVNVLALSLTGTQSLTDIVVSSTEKLSGDFTVNVSGDPLNPGAPTGADGGTTRTINFAEALQLDQTEAQRVNVVLPVFGSADSKISIKFIGAEGVQIVGPMALKGEDPESFATKPNHRYTVDVAVTLVPTFTVNKTEGKTVKFAPGNLYWDGSNWQFEANQWDYRTWAGKNSCIGGTVTTNGTPANHCGLFKWSDAANAVTGDYNYSDDLFCNSGFEVEGETWFTLSNAEWGNLLGGGSSARDNASSLRGWRTVAGVPGLVILPDNTGEPATVLSGITTAADLAAAGAVFLPAAGVRYGTDVQVVGTSGRYWSSTPGVSDEAWSMIFTSKKVLTFGSLRKDCHCVRLVK